jgi:hypothetical protein
MPIIIGAVRVDFPLGITAIPIDIVGDASLFIPWLAIIGVIVIVIAVG